MDDYFFRKSDQLLHPAIRNQPHIMAGLGADMGGKAGKRGLMFMRVGADSGWSGLKSDETVFQWSWMQCGGTLCRGRWHNYHAPCNLRWKGPVESPCCKSQVVLTSAGWRPHRRV